MTNEFKMKDKVVLILINNAFRMGRYHMALGESLQEKGAKVIFALADRLPLYTEKLNFNSYKYYEFSTFFKENFHNSFIPNDLVDININKLFFSDYDRNIVHGKMKFKGNYYYKSLMVNLINFFDNIYQENKIDYCLYESISNSYAYAAYEVGLKRGVKYIGYQGSRLKNRFELYTEEFGSREYFKEIFKNISFNSISEEDKISIKDYLSTYNSKSMPTYHPRKTRLDWNFSIVKRYLNIEKINLFIRSFKFVVKEYSLIKFSYQSGNPINEYFKAFWIQLKKIYTTRASLKYFDKTDFNKKYFLYPQHFKPEASTSVLAREYCSDIALIENIAFNLPFGTELYVKEHFVNFGRMPLSFYKKIKQIPNVRLIKCEENTKSLVDNSQGIITLTSTVGFEALLIGKPVYVLGKVFYDCHPNCRKISSFEQLSSELRNLSINNNAEINIKFIAAYRKITYKGNIAYGIGDENYKTEYFTEPFINAINERIC